MNELQQLKKEIEELKNWKKSLESSYSIPLEIDQSFRDRFSNISANNITTSGKVSGSEDVGVNESGASSYSVLGPPDAFLQLVVGGTTYYIPVYT